MKIGIIGLGKRMNDVLDRIFELDMGVRIRAVADIDAGKVRQELQDKGIDINSVSIYDEADEMLEKEELDGVMIGTRCSSHARMAVKVLRRKLPLFLEKPVATNIADVELLRKELESSNSQVVVSFPLRATPLVKLAKEIIDSGKLGRIEHVQAVNNVPYGEVYYKSWYRDESETGGLFLQKATHDIDYINYLLDLKPAAVCAMKSKQVFKGDKAEGLLCKDCDEYEACPESPFVQNNCKRGETEGNMCCFAKDTGNEDSGSMLIRYETGMHAVYSQNFFARNEARLRGARLLGYYGTLEFDWYKDELKVFMHHTGRTETYSLNCLNLPHFGGDSALVYNFVKVMQGRAKSIAPLEAGILSALMCMKARESAETDSFRQIEQRS